MGDPSCCCSGGDLTILFACSGASNVGQLANDAAMALARDKRGSMSCVAAIGAHLEGFLVSARDADRLVVLDGCDQHCGRRTFEHVGMTPHLHLEMTACGFEKHHGAMPTDEEVRRVRDLVVEHLERA